MRNEHRSRSYGSLANLQFDPNGEVLGPNGDQGSPEMLNDRKKDRDMMQMMDNMELDEDQIERSEVPAGFYPAPRMYRGPGPMPMHPGMNGHPGHPLPVAGQHPGPGRRRR